MPNIDPHSYPGPLEDLEKKQNQSGEPDKGRKIAIVVALGILVVSGLIMFLVASGEKIDIEEIFEEGGIFSIIPFWFIIFIPMIFKKKKQNTDPAKQENQAKTAIAIVAAVAVAIMAAVIFLINN